MKKIVVISMMCTLPIWVNAQSLKRDSLDITIETIYNRFLPFLDRVEITGSSEASQELRRRWSHVVHYLKNNRGTMTEEVKNLLLTPGGTPIDLELVKKFIHINRDDSISRITLNPDAFLDELKNMGDKVKGISIKMAEMDK